MSEGIKETLELLDGLKLLAQKGKEVAKDGKFDKNDIDVLLSLVLDAGKLIESFKGLGNLPKEVKDLDSAETSQILSKVLEIVNAVRS